MTQINIVFVNLTEVLRQGRPVARPLCAFYNEDLERFMRTEDGTHLFEDPYDIEAGYGKDSKLAKVMLSLVPAGFFSSWVAEPS